MAPEMKGADGLLTKETLVNRKEDLENLAKEIGEGELELLVEWLKEKDDNIRYAAFLLLQSLSAADNRVYRYWETLARMIGDPNSYQRSLGLMLISENIKWDKENKFATICDEYLSHCDDEKFITARQCIQGLHKVLEHSTMYRDQIVNALVKIDLGKRKDTQQGLMLLDIIGVLEKIYDETAEMRVAEYFRAKYEHGDARVRKTLKKYIS